VYKDNTKSKNERVVKVHGRLAQGHDHCPAQSHGTTHTKRNNKQTKTTITKHEELHYKQFRSVQMVKEPSMALAINTQFDEARVVLRQHAEKLT
jgi:hypothetical protein